jgi:VIT1/CCC1 family predicted Fe2+/Mn2+ transporter
MGAIRHAYQSRDPEATKIAHETSPLLHGNQEGHAGLGSTFVKSIVFGGLDGILTTFAIVSAAVGASDKIDTASVLIFGFANLFADGFAMGFGEYTSSRAEMDFAKAERERERWELESHPEGEKKEMVDLYVSKGVSREDATLVMETLMKYPEVYLDLMMVDELGILPDDGDASGPTKQGVMMFASFVTFGAVPLLAYIPNETPWVAFMISCVLTTLCLGVLGGLKGHLSQTHSITAGIQMVINGCFAASVSYFVSYAISHALPVQPEVAHGSHHRSMAFVS